MSTPTPSTLQFSPRFSHGLVTFGPRVLKVRCESCLNELALNVTTLSEFASSLRVHVRRSCEDCHEQLEGVLLGEDVANQAVDEGKDERGGRENVGDGKGRGVNGTEGLSNDVEGYGMNGGGIKDVTDVGGRRANGGEDEIGVNNGAASGVVNVESTSKAQMTSSMEALYNFASVLCENEDLEAKGLNQVPWELHDLKCDVQWISVMVCLNCGTVSETLESECCSSKEKIPMQAWTRRDVKGFIPILPKWTETLRKTFTHVASLPTTTSQNSSSPSMTLQEDDGMNEKLPNPPWQSHASNSFKHHFSTCWSNDYVFSSWDAKFFNNAPMSPERRRHATVTATPATTSTTSSTSKEMSGENDELISKFVSKFKDDLEVCKNMDVKSALENNRAQLKSRPCSTIGRSAKAYYMHPSSWWLNVSTTSLQANVLDYKVEPIYFVDVTRKQRSYSAMETTPKTNSIIIRRKIMYGDKRSVKSTPTAAIKNGQKTPEIGFARVPQIPLFSAWIALRENVPCPDDSTMRYVPWFGDDDDEDVFGDVYDEHDLDTQRRDDVKTAVAEAYELGDEILEAFIHRFCLDRQLQANEFKKLEKALSGTLVEMKDKKSVKVPTSGGGRGASDTLELDAGESFICRCGRVQDRLRERLALPKLERKVNQTMKTEGDVMDSFRTMFCRVCFVYDCAVHGAREATTEMMNLSWIRQIDVSATIKAGTDLKSLRACNDTPCGGYCYLVCDSRVIHRAQLSDYQRLLSRKTLVACRRSSCKASELLNFVSCAELYEMSVANVDEDEEVALQAVQQMRSNESPLTTTTTLNPSELVIRPPLFDELVVNAIRSYFNTIKNYSNHCRSIASSATGKKSIEGREKGGVIELAASPCEHAGPCTLASGCTCAQAGAFCSKHCGCTLICCEPDMPVCRNFFPGCYCFDGCLLGKCICMNMGRACDVDVCRHSDMSKICRNGGPLPGNVSHLVVAESTCKGAGFGIFTRNAVIKGQPLANYLGEIISQDEAERRGRYYDKVNRSYLFNINSEQVVDAFRKGNKIKFANHSKRSNVHASITTVDRVQQILLHATRDLEAGDELFFDYHYDQPLKSEFLIKRGIVADWMRNRKNANQIRKRPLRVIGENAEMERDAGDEDDDKEEGGGAAAVAANANSRKRRKM